MRTMMVFVTITVILMKIQMASVIILRMMTQTAFVTTVMTIINLRRQAALRQKRRRNAIIAVMAITEAIIDVADKNLIFDVL